MTKLLTLTSVSAVIAGLSVLYVSLALPDHQLNVRQEAALVISATAAFAVMCVAVHRLLRWGYDWRTQAALVTALVAAGVGLWITFAWIWPWYETR